MQEERPADEEDTEAVMKRKTSKKYLLANKKLKNCKDKKDDIRR